MGIMRILLWLGYALLASATLMLVTTAVGMVVLEFRDASLMAILALLSAMLGTLMITGSYRTNAKESASEAILFLILFWTVVPIICAIPFFALGAVTDIPSAMFEGISAMTTTGASQLNPDELSRTMLFWRSLLQFFGGVSAATFAVVILAALNLTGLGIHRSTLFTLQTGALFPRLVAIGRLIAAIYALLAAIACAFMIIGGGGVFNSVCLALSGISTGGLQPESGPVTTILSPFSGIVLAVLCLLGAFNVSVLWDVLRQRRLQISFRLFTQIEHRGLFGLIGALIILSVIFASFYNLGPAILDAVFFVSSAGYRYDVISLDMIPAPILVTFALIGGSALSTASGIKIIRILLLFRHLGTDMARLSHPSRIVPIQFRSRVIEDRSFLSVWMYFFGYATCFAGGALALSAVGLNLEDSLTTSAASLANIGPLLDLTLPESGLRYQDFTVAQMTLSAILMLIGRVEVLVALALLLPSTWRQ